MQQNLTEQQKDTLKNRRLASRILAVQLTYSILQDKEQNPEKVLNRFEQSEKESSEILQEYGIKAQPDMPLLRKLFLSSHEFAEKLDGDYAKFLKSDWKFERLNLTIRAILRVGTCELLMNEGKDAGRIISDYVIVARSFLEESEVEFINAILDKIYHEK